MPNDSPIPTSADIREFRTENRRLLEDIYDIKLSVAKMVSRLEILETRSLKAEDKWWDVTKMILPWLAMILYFGLKHWLEVQP